MGTEKPTNLMELPEDWIETSLDDLSSKISVGIASSATHAYVRSGIPLIRNQNIKPNRLDDTHLLYVSENYEIRFKNKRLDVGDLITARTGYPGTTCKIPSKYRNAQSFTTLITRPISGIDTDFLCFYMNSDYGKHFFEQNMFGGAQKNVNAAILRKLLVPVPPKTEQKSIAKALSDTAALITALEKLIAKKRAIKTATMQQLLTGKTRLPGFGVGKGYKDSELGRIPEDWELVSLGEIADVVMGQSPAGKSYNHDGNGTPLINGPVEFTKKYPVAIQWTTAPTKICRDADLLICVRGSSTGRTNISNGKYCIGRGVAAIRGKEKISDTSFIAFQIYRNMSSLLSKIVGSTFPSIDGKTIRNLVLFYPPYKEQMAVANVIDLIDDDIDSIESKKEKIQSIKKTMMQQLLTGRTRLK